ncbi:MAG: ABC transporter substrate-binding protein [Alphaproteobacteria bacterium]|jgi:peptide/nickel transport system substrate-binding protein|nr:ABC transporter substrate-binding protein [Alphaproteobacteria bacterium]
MTFKGLLLGTAAAATLAVSAGAADAQNVIRWASAGDALTLDPHAQNEGPTTAMLRQMYDTLIERDIEAAKAPSLATSWTAADDTSWVFELREGVTFHNGNPFMANDVVFSINRAMSETSDFKSYLSSVTGVEAIDDYTVRITTDGPNPILPEWLTSIFIMDEEWSVENGVEQPQNYAEGEETYAVRNVNGTGAYELVSREPDIRTVMAKNDGYWGADMFAHELDEIVYTPVASAPTRVAALLSGEIDFLLDPPVQDLERLAAAEGLAMQQVNQVRTIFLGMNVGADDLENDNVDGANPFADPLVREAVYRAIDIEAIQNVVMRGLSVPAGMVTSPGVNGYSAELDERLEYDPALAEQLLEEAGYGDGFEVSLHCPNDRYVNDEAICTAVVGMLGQVGVTVNLISQPKSIHFAELQQGVQDFYMLGWGVPTYDSEYVFNYLFHTTDGTRGSWNFTGYSNPEMDELVQAMQTEVDLAARDELIAEAWEIANESMIYTPLHHQVITWAMNDGYDVPIRVNDEPLFKYATVQ